MTAKEIRALFVVQDLSDKEVSINGYKGIDDSIVIPSAVGNKTVTMIGERAFRPESHRAKQEIYRKIRFIDVPETVTSIGYEAFENCTGLHKVSLSNSLTRIGEGAFKGCKNLQNISMPETINYIPNSLFSGCENLTTCELKNPETLIEGGAFFHCGSLKRIIVPGEGGLSRTYSFKAYNFLGHVSGAYAFCGCEQLEGILLSKELRVIPEGLLNGCASLKEVIIPTSVEVIEKNAFRECASISQVVIPSNVKYIETWAFLEMQNLKTVEFKGMNTEINDGAFKNCPKVTFICDNSSAAAAYANKHQIPVLREPQR